MTREGVHARIVASLVLISSVALADSAGPPLDPTDFSIVKEEPCDPKAAVGNTGPLIAQYAGQIGLDGKWFQPYPCEVIASTSKESYLRFAKWNVPCEIVGSVSKKSFAFSGSMGCDIVGGPANLIGDETIIE